MDVCVANDDKATGTKRGASEWNGTENDDMDVLEQHKKKIKGRTQYQDKDIPSHTGNLLSHTTFRLGSI